MTRTICPKCGEENSQHVSCTHCGIIFEKYAKSQLRQRELEQAQWEREDRRKRQWLTIGGGLLAGGLVLSLFLFSSEPTNEVAANDEAATASTARDLASEYYPWERGTTPGYWEREGTQLRWVPTPGQPILAELAAHLVTTGNRNGIGIVVTDDCHVIYSGDLSQKTAIEYSEKKSRQQQNYDRQAAALDEARQRFDKERIQFIKTCKVCDEQHMKTKLSRYISKVDKLEKSLAKAAEELDRSEKMLEQARQYRVYLNNRSANARIIERSKHYPLTLLLLDDPPCKHPPIGEPDKLEEKTPVFALTGVGKDAVYAGQFSGRSRQPDAGDYLLHDIAIPRGDYGTPLFDKEGALLGITTKPAHGDQRAIPIDAALQDLKLFL
jgi:hypothetical protein